MNLATPSVGALGRALPIAIALVVAAYAAAPAARALRDVRKYRFEAWEGAPALTEETTKAALECIAKRFAHPGYPGGLPILVPKAGGVELHFALDGAENEEVFVHLAERRGLVEFRVRAATKMEDEWRDKRLNEGAAPPEGYAWVPDAESTLQALVETPEAAAYAKLEALVVRQPKGDEKETKEWEDAKAEVAKVLASSVFSNSDVGVASVRRAMSRIGAQSLMHVSVRFEFKDERRAAFEKFTGDHVGRVLCVIVDGKVHVSPVLKTALPGAGELRAPGTGYTDDQAREMAAILESGPLPCKLVRESDK